MTFNPPGVVLWTLAFSYYIIFFNASFDKSRDIEITSQDQLFSGINYVLNVLCLLVFTTITKKIGNRPRPHNPCEDEP